MSPTKLVGAQVILIPEAEAGSDDSTGDGPIGGSAKAVLLVTSSADAEPCRADLVWPPLPWLSWTGYISDEVSRTTVLTFSGVSFMHMRMHIELDDALVIEIDNIAGLGHRSAFVRAAVVAAVERYRRESNLRQAAGILRNSKHDWDEDPAAWVNSQRRSEPERVG